MATKTAILSVKIVSDAKDFSSKMDTSASKLDQFQQKAAKLAVPAAAVVAGLGAIAIGAGKMASEAEQNFGAVDAVFKEHANSVKDMASKSAENLGLSGSDYAKYSALLGSQLKNAGVPMDQLAGKTDELIGYGADFAAQFGGTVPEAVEALSSALKGEMDPIEKYGISLNQSAIDAELARLGMDGLTGAAGAQAKAQAIMNLIQTQGADAMGAFGREAGTAAGQQAIATAKWNDASAALGSVLLPIMTQAATVLAEVAKFVMENQTAVTAFVVVIGILAAAIVALNVVLTIMNVIAALNPFVLIAVAVTALIAVIIYLATQTTIFQDVWRAVSEFAVNVWRGFTDFVKNAWTGVVDYLKLAAQGFSIIWQTVTTAVSNAWNAAGNFIKGIAVSIASYFVNTVTNIQNTWNAGMSYVRGVVQSAINTIIGILLTIGVAVINVVNNARNAFTSGFNTVVSFIGGAINTIIGILTRVGVGAINAVNSARDAFANGFNAVVSFVGGAINNVISIVNRIISAVINVVNNVRNGFANGFNAVVSFIGGAVNNVISIVYRIINAVSTTINSARSVFNSGFQAMQNFAFAVINNVVGGFNNIVGAVSNAISWVRSLFNLGGMPGWLSKVLGMGGTGFEFTGAFAPTAGEFGMGATGGLSYGSLVSGSRTSPVVNNYQITVNGALDPQSVARQIKGILNKDDRTNGKIEVGQKRW